MGWIMPKKTFTLIKLKIWRTFLERLAFCLALHLHLVAWRIQQTKIPLDCLFKRIFLAK